MQSSLDGAIGTPVRTWHITNASPRSVAAGVISNNSTDDVLRLQAGALPHNRTRTEAILRSVQRTTTAILLSSGHTPEERARRLAGVFLKARSLCSEELPLASILNEPLSSVGLPPLVHEILRLPSSGRSSTPDVIQMDNAQDLAVVRFLVENWDGSLIHIPPIGRGDLSSTVRKACLRRRDDDSGNRIFQMIRPLISSRMSAPDLDRRIRDMLAHQPSTDFSIDLRPLHEVGLLNRISIKPHELYAFEGIITARNLLGHFKSSPSISRRGSTHSLRGEQIIRRPLPSPQPSTSPTSGWFRDSKHYAIFAAEFLANNCAWSLELGQNSIKLTLLDSEGFDDTDGFFVEATIDLIAPTAFTGECEDEPSLTYRFALPTSRLYFPSQPRKGTNSIILAPCFQTERTSSQDVMTSEDEIIGFDDDRLKLLDTGELSFKLMVRQRRPAVQFKVPRRVQGPRPASSQSVSHAGSNRRDSRLFNADVPSALHPIREVSPHSLDEKRAQSLESSKNTGHPSAIPTERRSRPMVLSISTSSGSSEAPSLLSGYLQSSSTVATSVELSSLSPEIRDVEKTEGRNPETRKPTIIERQSTDLSKSQYSRGQTTSLNRSMAKPIEADMYNLVEQVVKDGWRRSILQEIEEVYGINLPISRKPEWGEHNLEEKTWVFPFSLYFCLQFLHWSSSSGVLFVDVSSSNLLAEVLVWQKYTPFKAIASIASMRAAVIDILRLTNSPKTAENGRETPDGAWSRAINYALKRDIDDLTRLISVIVTGGNQVLEEVASSQDKDFHTFTDIIQQQIDKQAGSYRTAERFLQKVVRISGRLPKFLLISDVKRLGDNPLAGGGFADVWKGKAREIYVALKVLRIFGLAKSTQPLKEFCMEAMIWRQLRHRNILPFYGVCIDEFSPQLALVSPWMVNGDVLSYTKKYPSVNRIALVTEIASGIVYLHNSKPIVVHGDLRSANILVDDRGCPKVADFGLAKVIDSQASAVGGTSFAGKGAMRWQSPELLNSSRFEGTPSGTTTSSDVYAFACVCLEIFTDEVPFFYLRDGEVVLEVAIKDTRPRRPPEPAMSRGLLDPLWDLMQRCWATHPSARPEIGTVYQELSSREISHAVIGDL